MRKYFYSILAATTLLFAASCSQDDGLVSGAGAGDQNVTFTVQLPGAAESRAIAEGVEVGGGDMADHLICALYEAGKTDQTPLILKEVEERGNGVFEVALPMAKDLTYELLFMAYNKENCAFDVNFTEGDLTSVDLQKLTLKSELKANQEAYDVFVKHITHKVNAEAVTYVTLKRPFAQVNAATTLTDLNNAATLKAVVTESKLVVNGVPNVYNVLTGDASGEENLTYDVAPILEAVPATTPVNETITVEESTYYYLAMAYILVDEEQSMHDAVFTFNRADGNSVSTISVPNMPIQRNYRTNVIGELLTHAESFQVVVDEEFNEPANIISFWDGTTLTQPAYDEATATWTVTNAAEYAWLCNHSNPAAKNGGTALTSATIEIVGDINLNNYQITGITVARNAEVTVNANGHTVSNAVVVSGANDNGTVTAGLFVSLPDSKVNINDLNVKGINVVAGDTYADRDSCPYAGVICGYVEGTLSLSNVNVADSKAHGLHSVGGMLGFVAAYGSTTINNCTVDNVTLTDSDVEGESGAMGGLVGRVAGTLTVENATVSNSTIEAYVGTADQQKRSVAKYIGNFVGGGTINVTNGAIENVTIDAKNELASTQSCLYGDFLGGWRGDGGTVTINGVTIEKDNASIVTTAEQLAAALANAQDGDVIGIGATIATKSLNANGKKVTIIGMTENAGIDASTSGFSTWSAGITAKNLTIKSHPTAVYSANGINCSGDIKFENCDFEGVAVAMNGNFVYSNCTFTNTNKGSYAAWVYSGAATYDYCTFNGVDRAAKVYTESGYIATVTYNNCKFNSTEANKAAVEIDATNKNGSDEYYTININNATVNGMGEGELTGSVYCNIEGTNANVYVDGEKFVIPFVLNNGVWEIYTAEGLSHAFASTDNVASNGVYKCHVKLMNDIDLKGATWTAITRPATVGWGLDWNNMVLDGNGKTISNVKLASEDGVKVGLFSVFFGTVKNLNLKNVEGEGTEKVGAIAGQMLGKIENCTVENVTFNATEKVGGLVGQSSGLTITDCEVTGANLSSTEKEVGGLVGCIDGDAAGETHNNNTVAGSVKSANRAGALYGYAYVTVSESGNDVSGMTVTQE